MLGFFRKEPTSGTATGTADLSKRPITAAIVSAGAAIRNAVDLEARQVGLADNDPPPVEPTQLDDRIVRAVQIIGPHIIRCTVEKLGRTAEFFPMGQTLPRDAPALMTLALFVVAWLHVEVEAEGCNVPQSRFMEHLPRRVFYGWPEKDVSAVYKKAVGLFALIRKHPHPNVKEWQSDCKKGVLRYVEQQGTDNPKLKDADFIWLFGRLFERLSATVQER
jgi:hypothetical protein